MRSYSGKDDFKGKDNARGRTESRKNPDTGSDESNRPDNANRVHNGVVRQGKESAMSRCMQLTVTVQPHYPGDFEGSYPKLARHIGHLDPALPHRGPSLYELAGLLDQLLYRFEGTRLGAALLRHKDKLRGLHKSIRENIADWNLAQADRLMYSLEDTFDELEGELD